MPFAKRITYVVSSRGCLLTENSHLTFIFTFTSVCLSLSGSYSTTYRIIGSDLIALVKLGNFFAWSSVADGAVSFLALLLVGACW